MKKSLLVIFILLSMNASALDLTEIMFNPSDGNEWLEFYTDKKTNISEYIFRDNYQKDTFSCCNNSLCNLTIPKDSTFLILDQDSTLPKQNNSLYFCVDDNSLGNGLGNTGDKIIVLKGNKTIINFSYTKEIEKGKSLSKVNGTWIVTIPTPNGEALEYSVKNAKTNLELEYILPKTLFTNIEYRTFFKIKNNKYPEYKRQIILSFYKNITGKNNSFFWEEATEHEFVSYTTKTGPIFIDETGEYLLCGETFFENKTVKKCVDVSVIETDNIPCNVSLSMKTDKAIYDEGETIKIQNKISNDTFPYEIEYWVEDLFGQEIKSKRITQNTNMKRFTPKIDENEKVFIINSKLRNVMCNNTNKGEIQKKLVAFRSKKENKSIIDILNVYSVSKEIEFGTPIKARVFVYKGDTTKNSIKAYVQKKKERVSYTTYFNIYKPFREHEITLPILLKGECKYETGEYSLYVEGLGVKKQKNIKIQNLLECDVKEKTEKDESEIQLITYTRNITGNNVFSVIEIFNEEDERKNYSVWSYVYKGPKSYSGEREENKRTFTVLNNSRKKIMLQNKIQDVENGEYGLKIKTKKEGRKTPIEITKKIHIMGEKENNKNEVPVVPKNKTNPVIGKVVYESASQKTRKQMPFLLVGAVFLIVLALSKLRNIR